MLIGGGSAFAGFMAFADWLYAQTGKTHQIALERLFDLAHQYLVQARALDQSDIESALHDDYAESGASGRLGFMDKGITTGSARSIAVTPARQRQHLVEVE